MEALGYGKKSQCRDIDEWKTYKKVRLYYPYDVPELDRYDAENYAFLNLRDWNYQALPSVYSNSNLNCATLVWKAYRYGANKEFLYNSSESVIPQNMVQWWCMTQKVNVDWPGIGW